MDEPLSNLDAKLRVEMRAEIKALQRETAVTTVFVTHDQVEAMTMGDRIAVMRGGVLEQVGDPDTIYNHPANVFVAGFIGSPAMTFGQFDRGGESGAELVHGDVRIPLDGRDGLPDTVVAGVRPEHVRPWSPDAGLAGPFQGDVESIEALGRETFVGVRCTPDLAFTVRFEGTSHHTLGEPLRFGIEPGRIHLFDPGSETAVAAAARA